MQFDDIGIAVVDGCVDLNLFGSVVKLVCSRLIGPAFSADVGGQRRGRRGVAGLRGIVVGQVVFDQRDGVA